MQALPLKSQAVKATAAALAFAVVACGGTDDETGVADGCAVVATTPILGSVTDEMVGDQASVSVVIPDGSDFHDFEASAKQVAAMTQADLVVENGLGLESGLEDAIDEAADAGTTVFTATDHLEQRTRESDDPHFWLDPLAMRDVTVALGAEIEAVCTDVTPASMTDALEDLHEEIAALYDDLPEDKRNIVSGHDSLVHHAERYGLTVVGALVPSLSTQAEATAANLADLTEQIDDLGICTVFSDVAESPDIAEAISTETGAQIVALPISEIPDEGTYEAYLRVVAAMLVDGLRADC